MASPFDQIDFDSWLAGSTESARVTVPLVIDAISPRSVVDVGCGLGAWLAVFREHGVDDLLGYDGPWGVEVLSEELRNLPIEQIFERAYETTSAQLAAARESRRLDGGEQGAERERSLGV